MVVDNSQHSIQLTLWGQRAKDIQLSNEQVIAVKRVKVGDYGGLFFSSTERGSALTCDTRTHFDRIQHQCHTR